MTRLNSLLHFCCAALLLLAGCARQEEAEQANNEPVAVDSASRSDSTFSADTDRVVLPPDRIYHTLTAHAWYARGEPLMHGGRAFRPAGLPVAASLPEMERAGEYQGVEYYRRGDADTLLFVPVDRGYWQVFRDEAAPR